jgi:hypothetical protein
MLSVATQSSLRNRVWNNLVDIKFKALYACECARKADLFDRVLSVVLAICGSAGVAAWSIWQQHARIWAVVIGVSQVLAVARPYLPFLKNESKFLGVSFELEALYLEYEKLWYKLESNSTDASLASRFDKLRRKALEIEKHGPQFPRVTRWMNRIDKDKDGALKIDFP